LGVPIRLGPDGNCGPGSRRESSALGDSAKAVAPGAAAKALDARGARDLSEEGGERVLAGYLVPSVAHELEPLFVVDGPIGTDSLGQHFNYNLSEPLAAEALVEVVDSHLRRDPKQALDLLESLLVGCGLTLEYVEQLSESSRSSSAAA